MTDVQTGKELKEEFKNLRSSHIGTLGLCVLSLIFSLLALFAVMPAIGDDGNEGRMVPLLCEQNGLQNTIHAWVTRDGYEKGIAEFGFREEPFQVIPYRFSFKEKCQPEGVSNAG